MVKIGSLLERIVSLAGLAKPQSNETFDAKYPTYFRHSGKMPTKKTITLYHITEAVDENPQPEPLVRYGLFGIEEKPTLSSVPVFYDEMYARPNEYIIALEVPRNLVKKFDDNYYTLTDNADKIIEIPEDVQLNHWMRSAFENSKKGVGRSLRRLPADYINIEETIRINIEKHETGWIGTEEGKRFMESVHSKQ